MTINRMTNRETIFFDNTNTTYDQRLKMLDDKTTRKLPSYPENLPKVLQAIKIFDNYTYNIPPMYLNDHMAGMIRNRIFQKYMISAALPKDAKYIIFPPMNAGCFTGYISIGNQSWAKIKSDDLFEYTLSNRVRTILIPDEQQQSSETILSKLSISTNEQSSNANNIPIYTEINFIPFNINDIDNSEEAEEIFTTDIANKLRGEEPPNR